MHYKCPECSKIIDGYIEKCPDCGTKISMTDSISDAEDRNIENSEENEQKFELLQKRIKNGYIATALIFVFLVITSLVLFIAFDIPGNIVIALEPVLVIVWVVIYILIFKKFHFFSCPHCDIILRRYNMLYSEYCPHCGKRIRK